MIETDVYCPKKIGSVGIELSLGECKKYCETNDATRLTYYALGRYNCRCCSASSEVKQSIDTDTSFYTSYKVEGN